MTAHSITGPELWMWEWDTVSRGHIYGEKKLQKTNQAERVTGFQCPLKTHTYTVHTYIFK